MGMFAAMTINMEKNVGRPTATVASRIASRRDDRSRRMACPDKRRNTFSTTMTAPSTMIPKSIAPSERRLAGIPRSVRPMNVASSERGMITATIAAARTLPRNKSSTAPTSMAPSSKFLNTVFRVVSMSQVRS